MKLAPKLTILFLLLAIVPTAIIGYLAYENGRRTIVQKTIDHLVSIKLFKNNELKRWIEDNERSIEELVQRPLVRQFAAKLAKHDTPDHAYHKVKGSIIEDHLKPRLKYGRFFELFLMCPRHGLISASTNEKQEGKYRDTYPYFIEGKSRTYIQGIYYSPMLQQPAMTISTPIKDKQGNFTGVLAGRLDLEELSKIIALQSGKSLTEDTYLVDTFNFFVTEPRFGQGYALKKAVRTEGVEAGLSGKDGVGFYKDYRGVLVIGAYKWLPEFKMCIITEIDQAEAFAPIVHLAWVITGIASAISIAAGLLGLFFARTITRPVHQLVKGAEEIGRGNLDYKIGTASKGEIGELSRVLERMAKELKVTMVSRDELAKSEERFRIGATSGSDLIWDWDIPSGRLDWFGDIDGILGYQPGEFPRTIDAWGKAVHGDDVARINATLERHLKGEEPYYEEYHIRCKDGTYRYWTDRGTAMRDGKGEAYRMIGACSDITKRKRTEESLRSQTERLRNLHRTDKAILLAVESPEAITQTALQHIHSLLSCQRASVGIFDLEKKKVRVFAADVNGETIVQTGKDLAEETYGDLEILRQSRMEIVEDMSRATSPPAVARIFQAEGIRSCINVPLLSERGLIGALNIGWEEARAITPEEMEIASEMAGQITIAIEQARLLKETKRYAVELEERVRDRTVQLEAANKELEAFSYSVSHDLRAPLRAIDGFSRVILEDYTDKLDDEGKRYLNIIGSNTKKMGQLIDDILALSRLGRQEIKRSEIDMDKLAKTVFKELKPAAHERKVEFNINKLPSSHGDQAMIRQVLINLLSNAVKFTKPKENATIEVEGGREGNENIYYVKDNGVGFDMQYANKLFGVFQRLHSVEEFEGTGVGLAIVQRIIHRHGGKVWAEGKVGEGATFYFSLPAKK